MALQLERAVRYAEDPHQVLPVEWVERTEHMAGCPSRTYVAALGVALLARATDERIDALTIKRKVSANAYSMRGAATVLAGNASLYGYHLGVTGPEPLNNQPWFHGERIDQFRIEDKEVEPFQNNLVRYLRELNGYGSPRALMALAAFVRVRQKFAAQLGAAQSNLEAAGLPGFSRLVGIAEEFIRSNPEGGRRGQALVAAVLDLAHDEVHLSGIHDPRPRDVAVLRGGEDLLFVEVKQKPVDADTADHLAREAKEASVDKALLVALAPDQEPLDRESVRRSADAHTRLRDGRGAAHAGHDPFVADRRGDRRAPPEHLLAQDAGARRERGRATALGGPLRWCRAPSLSLIRRRARQWQALPRQS